MAAGTLSDFQIYSPQFFAGFTEVMQQNADVFNEQSRGAIVVSTNLTQGEHVKKSFFTHLADIVARRDPTSVAANADIKMSQGENISIKLNRKMKPVGQTLDSLVKSGISSDVFSFMMGQQIARQVFLDYLNTALLAARTALANQSAVLHDATDGTLATTDLVTGLFKFGDAAEKIVSWIGHSKVAADLVGDQLANYKFDSVGGFNIATASPITLGRPFIMTDSASLIQTTPDPDEYDTLGLVEGAIMIEESEERRIASEIVTGLENLVLRTQGEYAWNLSLKGFTWDLANGGVNPDGTALATAGYWDKTATSNKDLAGVIIQSQ